MASSITSTPYAAAQATAAASPQGGRKPFGVRYDAAKGLSAMLLAAMVSALVVVADQLIDTWADGHLLAAWVALWAVGFGALAIFGGAARKKWSLQRSDFHPTSNRQAAGCFPKLK